MMKTLSLLLFPLFVFGTSPNQTEETTPILPGSHLPFEVSIELANFSLPAGLHSGVEAVYDGKWILFAGRTNGLHGFNATNNFPPAFQNTLVYVIDPANGTVFYKDLNDPSSGLTQKEVDLLSVTSPQSYQHKKTLYMTGGYGIDRATGLFNTKPYLTAINLPGLVQWVLSGVPLKSSIRQLEHPIFQVTGGYMDRGDGGLTLLIFGQNFTGQYTPGSNGEYIEQVRRFYIHDDGKKLSVHIKKSLPEVRDPNYRRRDLNIIPIVRNLIGESVPSFAALSGVFTIPGGIWTVPVLIDIKGTAEMNNPHSPATFKQGMNNYVCPTLGLYSGHFGSMYIVLFGGLSYGYFDSNGFQTDEEIPFINQVTTITYDQHAQFSQYLMDAAYPVIPSNFSNPGNPLLFGAGAFFFRSEALCSYDNGVVKYDDIPKDRTLMGYIVGGIMSTLPNTSQNSDSAASPYIFKVWLKKRITSF